MFSHVFMYNLNGYTTYIFFDFQVFLEMVYQNYMKSS